MRFQVIPHLATTCLCLLLACGLAGCGKSKLPTPTEQFETVARVTELPYAAKPAQPPESAPWHKALTVELEEMPATAAALKEALEQHRAEAQAAAQGVLEQIQAGVREKRNANALWSVLSMDLGAGKPMRNGGVPFTAALGLTKLYARRAEISFDNVRLEECMRQLALQSGLRLPPARFMNPIVTWRRENISSIEAIDAILDVHNFDRKILGAYARVDLKAENFKTREEFVEAAVNAVIAYGKALDRSIAALTLSPRGRKEAAPKEDGDNAPAKTSPAPAPAPAPAPPGIEVPPPKAEKR